MTQDKKPNKKELIDIELKQSLAEFLKIKGYGIFNDGIMNIRYSMRKPKKRNEFELTEKIHQAGVEDYFMENYLEGGYKDIDCTDTFFEFGNYLLHKNLHPHLLQQLNKKNTVDNYEVRKYLALVVDLLGKNTSLLTQFFSKSSMWERETSFLLPKVLEKLHSQDEKIQVFNALFKSKSFSGIDKQVFVYPILKAQIKTYKQFEPLFNKIEINESKSSINNFKHLNTLVFDVDFKTVLSKNLGTELSIEDYINKFRSMIDQVIRENLLPELMLKNFSYNKSREDTSVITYYISSESNELKTIQSLMGKLLEKVEELKKQKDIYDLVPKDFIREEMIIARKLNMDSLLESKATNTTSKKAKI